MLPQFVSLVLNVRASAEPIMGDLDLYASLINRLLCHSHQRVIVIDLSSGPTCPGSDT